MSGHDLQQNSRQPRSLESRLAAYVAMTGAAAGLSADADAAIVANTTPQSFGINGEANIDFNADGQIDFQIDHDRYNLNGTDLDYLQIDKNDINSAADPLPVDPLTGGMAQTFPPNNTTPNNATDAAYLTSSQGSYPSALQLNDPIGPASTFDWQEGDNYLGGGQTIRANRLIDEDQTQIDQAVGGKTPEQVYVPTNGPNWVGLNGEVRYLGLKMHLNGAPNTSPQYGWVGVRIDNEADATGTVVGYAYETEPGVEILAGDTGPVVPMADYDDDGDVDGNDFLVWQRAVGNNVANGTGADGNGNGVVDGPDLDLWETQFGSTASVATGQVSAAVVPEPGSLLMAGLCAVMALALVFTKRRQRKLALARCRA
jgi:hypothetical protein